MLKKTMSDFNIKEKLSYILKLIEDAKCKRSKSWITPEPMLVAVSKTKPVNMIIEAYLAGQRNFGENYVQELIEKSSDPEILQNCPEIRWHFIGHLQTNKINKIVKVPGLYMIQTVDSEKLATNLNSSWERFEMSNKEPLSVLVQINTSGESEKNGIEPSKSLELFKYIKNNLPFLRAEGVMTIGKFGHDYSTGPNPDFLILMQCHKEICDNLHINSNELYASMGMSDDFQNAIENGSSIVRIGSSIFGQRLAKT